MLIKVPISLLTSTSIMVANSLTVTNSVSFNTLLSLRSALASALMRSCMASRFSLRYLAPFLFCVPLLVSLASVSFTWRATSSSFTSSGFWLRPLFFRFFLLAFRPSAFPDLLPPPLFPICLEAALMSTRCWLMRTRFLRPSPRFSSRSLRRSSLLFFLGRVLWLMVLRSIFPNTFTLGAFCKRNSLFVWKISSPPL